MRASGSCYKKSVHVHGKADRHVKLLTIETESRLGILWDKEGCNQFCSKEELWEAAREGEMKIPWQAANEGPPVPEEQYQERFWRRRLYGIGLDTATKEFLAIELKRTQDARSNYVERATAVAQKQHKSVPRSYFAQKGVTRSKGGDRGNCKGRECMCVKTARADRGQVTKSRSTVGIMEMGGFVFNPFWVC
jgi:hypothetical protein